MFEGLHQPLTLRFSPLQTRTDLEELGKFLELHLRAKRVYRNPYKRLHVKYFPLMFHKPCPPPLRRRAHTPLRAPHRRRRRVPRPRRRSRPRRSPVRLRRPAASRRPAAGRRPEAPKGEIMKKYDFGENDFSSEY